MAARNTTRRWGWVARLLHWSMAGLIFFMLGLGVWMVWFVPDLIKAYPLYKLHKSWGFVVFWLAVARVIWRLSDRTTPVEPPDTPHWQATLAKATHGLLYLLMFLLPLSGWVMASASPTQDLLGIQNMVFDLFPMPDPFVPGIESIETAARKVHEAAAILLTLVLAPHISGALKHALLDRDDVLARMTWGH